MTWIHDTTAMFSGERGDLKLKPIAQMGIPYVYLGIGWS